MIDDKKLARIINGLLSVFALHGTNNNLIFFSLKKDILLNPDGDCVKIGSYFLDQELVMYSLIDGDAKPGEELERVRLISIVDDDGKKRSLTFQHLVKCIPLYNHDLIDSDTKALIEQGFESNGMFVEKTMIRSLHSILPQKYVMSNTKAANELTKRLLNTGMVTLNVGTRKKKARTYVTMDWEGKNLSLEGKNFEQYDRAVYNAICSLYEAGNELITPETVYRAMTGKTNSERLSEQAVKEVDDSIRKLQNIKLTVDCSDEFEARGIKARGWYSDRLLVVREIEIRSGGITKRAYKFHTIPVLYEYSKAIGQVISADIRLLDTRNKLRTTKETIVLREYLLRRIELMKHENGIKSRKILYESIINELQLGDQTKDKFYRLRNNTSAILECWVEIGYIRNFTEFKEKKTLKGVEVNLNK